MEEILQPRTDAGVVVQVLITAALVTAVGWRVRHNPDLVRVVVGGGLLLGALFVLRGMH